MKDLMNKKRIALMLIATNKYIDFVKPLLESVDKWFLTDHKVDVYLFTNHQNLVTTHSPSGSLFVKQI